MGQRDYRVTLEDYMGNHGFSSSYFFEHFQYFMKNKPEWIQVDIYRYKIRLINVNTDKIKIMKVHWDGRSKKYASMLDRSGRNEVFTVRYDSISPMCLKDMIICALS